MALVLKTYEAKRWVFNKPVSSPAPVYYFQPQELMTKLKNPLDRYTVDYSPLSQSIRIGKLDAKRENFLAQRECTKEVMYAVFDILRDGTEWTFTEKDTGKKYSVTLQEIV